MCEIYECSASISWACETDLDPVVVQDFFEKLETWEEKLRVLKEASNFLVEVVEEPIAAQIKEQVLFIDGRSVSHQSVV